MMFARRPFKRSLCIRRALLLLAPFATAHAQDGTALSGRVSDRSDHASVPGAIVHLFNTPDTLQRKSVSTDDDGLFHFQGPLIGHYLVRVDLLGYERFEQAVDLPRADSLDVVLSPSNTALSQVEKVAIMQRAELKGDTTIYKANAYPVPAGASAEDLVTRMPGIINDGGTIKAQGEAVQRVLVDGEEFFGDDANIALKNLPAEVIDKVQVFDKSSDQAVFTGFDTGDREKTLNIVTKSGKNNGLFGRMVAGYGTDEHYLGSVAINRFKGAERWTLLAQTNNVNQQNFSTQDLSGVSSGGGRSRGGTSPAFSVGAQPGITTTNAAGLNYSNKLKDGTRISGSYFFNQQNTLNNTLSDRTTYLNDSSSQRSVQESDRTGRNADHRLSLRIEHNLDSSNSIILTPRIGFQRNGTGTLQNTAVTTGGNLPLSASVSDARSDRDALDLNNDLLFRHRFATKGRTFSARLTTGLTQRWSTGSLLATNHFSFPDTIEQVTDQRSTGEDITWKHALQLTYTETMGARGLLQFTAAPSYQRSRAEKLTYDQHADDGRGLLNIPLSNRADNTIPALRGGVGYRYKAARFSANIGVDAQGSDMVSEQVYPHEVEVKRSFRNLLPNAMLMWGAPTGTRLRLMYRTSTTSPSINQLQNVIDNSDPLRPSTGNLGLKQSYTHQLNLNFNTIDSAKTRPFFAMVSLQTQQDRISSVTYAPSVDSTLADGTILPAGSQLTLPMNLNGYVSARTFVNYGLPVTALHANLNLNAGASLERSPGRVNGLASFTNNTNWNVGAVIAGAVRKGVDLRLGYTLNFNSARNDLQPTRNNNYRQGRLTGKLSLLSPKGWLLENEVNYDSYMGLGEAYDREALVWNAAIGYKFGKNDAFEARLTCYDVLGRNVSVARTVGDTYIENSVTSMLQRYGMFTLTFDLRAFKGMAQAAPAERGPRDRPGAPPPDAMPRD